MRIAFVTTSYPSREGDPAGHFVRAEARARAREGHDVTVLAPAGPVAHAHDGVRVIAIDGGDAFGWPGVAARLRASPVRALAVTAWILRARRALSMCAREAPLDRVVAHWCLPSAWPIAAAGRAPVEVVSHGADVRLLVAMPAPVRSALVARVICGSVAWRFVAATLRDELLGSLGEAQRRAVEAIALVEPSPLEMPALDEIVRAAEALRAQLDGRSAYAAIGRLTPGKRVDRIVRHVADVARGGARRPVLVVVGDGPERARLEALARAEQVDARFVGTVDRRMALAWMAATGKLLFASEREGLPTVLREADALGVAVERVP